MSMNLSNEQQRVYNELRTNAVSELESGSLVTLTSIISKIFAYSKYHVDFWVQKQKIINFS